MIHCFVASLVVGARHHGGPRRPAFVNNSNNHDNESSHTTTNNNSNNNNNKQIVSTMFTFQQWVLLSFISIYYSTIYFVVGARHQGGPRRPFSCYLFVWYFFVLVFIVSCTYCLLYLFVLVFSCYCTYMFLYFFVSWKLVDHQRKVTLTIAWLQ